MIVYKNDVVRVRGYNFPIWVTDAVDQNAPEVTENPDDICVGFRTDDPDGDKGKHYLFPMSEVIEVVGMG